MKLRKPKFFLFTILCGIFLIILYFTFTKKYSGPIHIIYISKSSDHTNSFWKSIANGAKLAASEYNIILDIWDLSKQEDYMEQNKLIYEAISHKPNAIILAAADQEKTTRAANDIVNNGIKLVLIDSVLETSLAHSVVATNNYQAGIRVGASMKYAVTNDDKIGILSTMKGTSTAIDRESGIRMGLTNDKNRIVEVSYAQSDEDLAKELTINMIKEHPDIKVIATLNQYASVGAGRALEELELEDKIHLFGFDNSKEQISYLEDETFDALLIQKPFNMGYLSVENAIKIVRGESYEKEINTGSALITKENMYSTLNQKLLFPFMEE